MAIADRFAKYPMIIQSMRKVRHSGPWLLAVATWQKHLVLFLTVLFVGIMYTKMYGMQHLENFRLFKRKRQQAWQIFSGGSKGY